MKTLALKPATKAHGTNTLTTLPNTHTQLHTLHALFFSVTLTHTYTNTQTQTHTHIHTPRT